MKHVQAFRCDYCGKVYLKESSCKQHEQERCCQRPDIRPYCYSCKHYHQEFDKKENVIYYTGVYNPFTDDEDESVKTFDVNRCTHPDNERKLYNNIKLSAEMQTALDECDFYPMPTPKSGGCKYYEPIPEHPWAI